MSLQNRELLKGRLRKFPTKVSLGKASDPNRIPSIIAYNKVLITGELLKSDSLFPNSTVIHDILLQRGDPRNRQGSALKFSSHDETTATLLQ